jgi:hemoglobin
MPGITLKSSLYTRIGGDDTIAKVLNIFYKKVMNDEQLAPFFKNVEIERLINKQRTFLTFATGGPTDYTYWQRGLRNAHTSSVENGMNDTHFDLVVEHMVKSFEQIAIPDELISEVKEIVESTRKHVLNK